MRLTQSTPEARQAVLDMDGPLAVETRKRLLDRAVSDKMLVQGYHFPFPASGYVVQTGAHTFDLTPVLWQPRSRSSSALM